MLKKITFENTISDGGSTATDSKAYKSLEVDWIGLDLTRLDWIVEEANLASSIVMGKIAEIWKMCEPDTLCKKYTLEKFTWEMKV